MGLLRFLPKKKIEQLKNQEQTENYPILGYFDKEKKKKFEKMLGIRINKIGRAHV